MEGEEGADCGGGEVVVFDVHGSVVVPNLGWKFKVGEVFSPFFGVMKC